MQSYVGGVDYQNHPHAYAGTDMKRLGEYFLEYFLFASCFGKSFGLTHTGTTSHFQWPNGLIGQWLTGAAMSALSLLVNLALERRRPLKRYCTVND